MCASFPQAPENLAPTGLGDLDLKKRILSGRKQQGISAPVTACLSGHMAKGCWLSEEGVCAQ